MTIDKGVIDIGFPSNDNDDYLPVFTCRCGCQTFFITEKGHQCSNCGEFKDYEDIWG